MSKQHLYSVWSIPDDTNPRVRYKKQFHITKHNRIALTEEEHYVVKFYERNNWYRCECPGFVNWGKCRHQEITEIFIRERKVGTGSLYDYDNARWSNEFISISDSEE
jgi:hypothetical protein